MKLLTILVESQVNIIVQPSCAEAYDYICDICNQCQSLSNSHNKPVVLKDKNDQSYTFLPKVT